MQENDMTPHVRELVRKAFAGRTNKGGLDYYTYHLCRVEREAREYGLPAGSDTPTDMQMLCSVALLHDTFEDTDTPESTVFEALTLDGLSEDNARKVIRSVRKMTHDPAVPYLDYVQALSPDIYALLTKRSDLFNNMNVTYLPGLTDKDIERLRKYKRAYAIVMEALQGM